MTEAEQQLKRWEKKQKSTCLNEVATVLQRLRRLEEAGDDGYCACVTCGVVRKWNDGIQGGHYITRTCTSTKLEESNIWPQCDMQQRKRRPRSTSNAGIRSIYGRPGRTTGSSAGEVEGKALSVHEKRTGREDR